MGSFAGNLISSSFFLSLLDAAGGAVTFGLFGCIVLLGLGFVYGFLPETRHREPESIMSDIPSFGTCLSYTELAVNEEQSSDEVNATELQQHGQKTAWL